MKATPWLILFFGIIVTVTSIAGVVLNYSPVPFWDQWYGTVDWYMRAENDWWRSYWSLHNEHRLLFSRIIFWADMRWFGGVNIASLAGSVVTCALLSLTVYRAAIFQSVQSREAKIAVAGLSLAFCFSWMQAENFTWAFQNSWFAVYLFALLSFHCVCVSAAKQHAATWFGLGIASAIASAFSMANGSLAWAPFFLLLAYFRFPLRFWIATACVAGIQIFAYFWHANGATGTIPNGTPSYVLRHQLVDLIHYALLYLGSPMFFAFKKSSLATISGFLVVMSTAVGALLAWKRRDIKAVSLLAMAAFLCATALATGAGRLAFGLGNVFQLRYATAALVAWVALLIFWMLNAPRRPYAYVATLVALVAVAVCQPAAWHADRDVMYNRLVAGQAVRLGVYDHEYMHTLWDHDDYLRDVIDRARAQQLSILKVNTVGFDAPPERIESTQQCTGFVDGTAITQTDGMSKAVGWVYAKNEPQTVAITDSSGNTIGAGVVGGKRPDAAKAVQSKNDHLGWTAFYRSTSPIHVFAKTGDRYCQFN